MKETEVYQRVVKPWCKKNKILVHRMESKAIPDIYMTKNNNVLWAELKSVLTERAVVRPDWRPGQLAWIKENQAHGTNNICLILFYAGQIFWLEPKEEYSEEELICQKAQYLMSLNKK